MKPLMGEQKQKVLSSALSVLVSLWGFESLSVIIGQTYQVKTYMWVAVYIYAFHLLWLLFLFDLHLRKRGVFAYAKANHKGFEMFKKAFLLRAEHIFNWYYLRHYLNYLILPGIIFWSVVVLMAINPFATVLKQSIIFVSTLGLAVAYWYFKEVYSKNFELHHFGIKVLSLVKILATFLFYSASLGFTFYFGMSSFFLFVSVVIGTFLLMYQALFQHKLASFSAQLVVFLISLIMAVISYWLFQSWSNNYLTAGLIMTAAYNTAWGLLHHHMDGNLSRRLAFEYILLMILTVSIVIASHDFAPRIK